jgi:hypothetical protein
MVWYWLDHDDDDNGGTNNYYLFAVGRRFFKADYIEVREKNGGRRVINEVEAAWVRKMFQWLVEELMSTYTIT